MTARAAVVAMAPAVAWTSAEAMTGFSKQLKVAAASLVLAATALSVVPAEAASFSFGFGHHRGFCPIAIDMTDYQIRQLVRKAGYSNIYLNVKNDDRIQVRASRDGWVYLLTVNTCTGRIIDRDRLRRS